MTRTEGFHIATATESDFAEFEHVFKKHSLVLVRDPNMTTGEQITLLSRLGPVAIGVPGGSIVSYIKHDPADSSPEMGGKGFGQGELAWHFDMSYTEDFPQWIASLYGVKIPKVGGETRLMHCGMVYDSLDQKTKNLIADKRAIHIFDQESRHLITRESNVGSYALRSSHDMVWDHPYEYGKVLTIMETDTDRIVGMNPAESEALLEKLFQIERTTSFVYEHKWQVGDLIVWDNRVLQHARNDFDPSQARTLRRVACGDEKSILMHLQNRIDQLSLRDTANGVATKMAS